MPALLVTPRVSSPGRAGGGRRPLKAVLHPGRWRTSREAALGYGVGFMEPFAAVRLDSHRAANSRLVTE